MELVFSAGAGLGLVLGQLFKEANVSVQLPTGWQLVWTCVLCASRCFGFWLYIAICLQSCHIVLQLVLAQNPRPNTQHPPSSPSPSHPLLMSFEGVAAQRAFRIKCLLRSGSKRRMDWELPINLKWMPRMHKTSDIKSQTPALRSGRTSKVAPGCLAVNK